MARLLLDAQVFQTPALHRGMGKYSLELIRALSLENKAHKTWDSIELIISSKFLLDAEVQNELIALEGVSINVLELDQNDILNPEITRHNNRKIVDGYIDKTGDDVTYVILSLMQGELSSTFPSSRTAKRAVLFYDLIPLIFHKIYLQNPITRREYLSKLGELFMADMFLAISKTVANDLSIYLGVDPKRIVSINGGPINHDNRTEVINILKPFILMPTGNDLRKNNHRSIEGFELFNTKHNHKYSLVITSYFKDEQIHELSQLSSNLIFTGNLPGAKLNYLYDHADLLLFPSQYEGLGLPVLEALEHNLRVACSDITVFREISLTSFAFFDPTLVHSIADGLETAISSQVDNIEIKRVLNKYTWKNTVLLMNKALRESVDDLNAIPKVMNIVGSDYSGNSLVSKFILQSHAELSRKFSLSYYEAYDHKSIERRINFLPYITNFCQLNREQAIFANDTNLNMYHISNKKNDSLVLLNALFIPGVLMLHDIELPIVWMAALKENLISKKRYELESKINNLSHAGKQSWIVSLLSIQKIVIVFSKANQKKIELIKESLHFDFNLVFFDLPSNNLVYPEIIQDQKKRIDIAELHNIDDVDYESRLSKSRIDSIFLREDTSSECSLLKIESEKYLDKKHGGYDLFSDTVSNLINKMIAGN